MEKPEKNKTNQITYEATGMQKLYDTVRSRGAGNIVTVSGFDWGYDLSGVLQGYAIKGSNYLYETHLYPSRKNWDKYFDDISDKYPVYVGEWGYGGDESAGTNGPVYARSLMDFMQKHHLSWTAWDLHPKASPCLIKDWTYEPTDFGQIVKDKLAAAAAARGLNN